MKQKMNHFTKSPFLRITIIENTITRSFIKKKKELSSKINPCNMVYFNASVKSIITNISSLENIILGCAGLIHKSTLFSLDFL